MDLQPLPLRPRLYRRQDSLFLKGSFCMTFSWMSAWAKISSQVYRVFLGQAEQHKFTTNLSFFIIIFTFLMVAINNF
jgi:hypothetical protein